MPFMSRVLIVTFRFSHILNSPKSQSRNDIDKRSSPTSKIRYPTQSQPRPTQKIVIPPDREDEGNKEGAGGDLTSASSSKKRRKNEIITQQQQDGKNARGVAQPAALRPWEKEGLSASEQEFLMAAWNGDTARVLSMLDTQPSLM